MWTLKKRFRFEASHRLPHHDGKCKRLHGHSWVGYAEIFATELKKEGAQQGMVLDFGVIGKELKRLCESYLDHWHLNDTLELESPTSEEVARWIYNKLKVSLGSYLIAVTIEETCTSSCTYREPLPATYTAGIWKEPVTPEGT